MKTTLHTIIASDKNFWRAIYLEGDDGDSIMYDPIIAWDIERLVFDDDRISHVVTPVTPDGCDCTNQWAIKRPDGKFDVIYDCTLNSEKELLEHFRKNKYSDRSRRKANAG